MSSIAKLLSPASDPEVRATLIGGSDAPKIAEVSRWGCALDVFLEKLGLVEVNFDSEAAEWGMILEPVLLSQYAVRENVRVAALSPRTLRPVIYTPAGGVRHPERADADYLRPLLGTLRHPEHHFIGCHLDGWTLHPDGTVSEPIEAKTASAFRAHEWGAGDTDAMPDDYVVQCQHNSMVAGAHLGVVPPVVRGPTLIGGQRWSVQAVRPLATLQVRLLQIELEFWDCVRTRRPPPARADARGADALALLYPRDSGEERVIPPNHPVHQLALELHEARLQFNDAEKDKAGAENRVKQFMGTASKLTGQGWSITWKRTKDGTETDWEAAFRELVTVAGLHGIPKETATEIVQKVTKTKPGYRRLVPTFKEI